MIGPTTRVFGLVTEELADAWLVRLYNYLFGFNGLDAAYVLFVVKPAALETVLTGFVEGRKAEHLHLAPSLQAQAARWAKAQDPLIDSLSISTTFTADYKATGSGPEPWLARARDELTQWFGSPPAIPDDWAAAIAEQTFRPCKLIHDDFRERYATPERPV